MTSDHFASWRVSRSQMSRYLFAYGEMALGLRIFALSPARYDQVCDVCIQYRLHGIPLYRAASLAAVYVLEGKRRDLKRQHPLGIEVEADSDPVDEAIGARMAEYALGRPLKQRQVFDGVSELLAPLLPEFRYYRSQSTFRRPFTDGTAYLGMNCVRGTFDSFYFGIRHAH